MITSIPLEATTRDNLVSRMKKNETYDIFLNKLLKLADRHPRELQ